MKRIVEIDLPETVSIQPGSIVAEVLHAFRGLGANVRDITQELQDPKARFSHIVPPDGASPELEPDLLPVIRELEWERAGSLNTKLQIVACDEANTLYQIIDVSLENIGGSRLIGELKFHQGNPAEVGVLGVSNEAVLAIVADRLEQF